MSMYRYLDSDNFIENLQEIANDSTEIRANLNNQSLKTLLEVISTIPKNVKANITLNIPLDGEYTSLYNVSYRDIVGLVERWVLAETYNIELSSYVLEGIRQLNFNDNIDIRVNDDHNSTGIVIAIHSEISESTIIGNIESSTLVVDYERKTEEHIKIWERLTGDFQLASNKIRVNLSKIIYNAINNHISICKSDEAYQAYIAALLNINRNHISDVDENEFMDRMHYIEYRYQTDAVSSLLTILNKYGMAYLADSVGLGKTVVTLRLLNRTGYKALVIVPTDNIYNQWSVDIQNYNIGESNQISIIKCTNASMEKALSRGVDEFDIVIIDEAHNFKNRNTKRYQSALEICCGKQVLLLGATPITNQVDDFESQVMLGLDYSKQYDFGVGPLDEYFKTLKSKLPPKTDVTRYRKVQLEIGKKLRKDIVSKLVIRRTRKDIEKYYAEDIKQGTLRFPKVNSPVIVQYRYPGIKLANTLDILSGYNFSKRITYAIYNKSRYNIEEAEKENYELGTELEDSLTDLREDKREANITDLMKVMLIKLLDSSPQAFALTVQNIINRINNELYRTEDKEFNTIYSQYRKDLTIDLQTFYYLLKLWAFDDSIDIKAQKLLEVLNKHKSKKSVIFTEYIATADYIADYLESHGYRVLKIDSSNNKGLIEEVSCNFDNCRNPSNNYDVLVSTNILSEGVNLGRTAVAVNYDIAWNPMVVIQRVGRLNRVNSIEDELFIYNFFPCDEADSAILSESNIISKFVLANMSLGSDENYLISNTENSKSILDEQKELVDSIVKIDLDQSDNLDFRTVDFRYASDAQQKHLEGYQIDKVSHISVVEGIENAIYAIFEVDGNIVTCKSDSSGVNYIDSNNLIETLEVLKTQPQIQNVSPEIWKCMYEMQKFISQSSIRSTKLSPGAKDLSTIVNKLTRFLQDSYYNDEISIKNYKDRLDRLVLLSNNIASGYIKVNLCAKYAKQYYLACEKTGSYMDNIDTLLRIVSKRFYTGTSKIYENRVKCIGIQATVARS